MQPSLSSDVLDRRGGRRVLLLAANPLVGAAVGAGTLLAQKMMKDPIEQMFSYEYRSDAARGRDPVVERVGARAQQAAPGAPATAPTAPHRRPPRRSRVDGPAK